MISLVPTLFLFGIRGHLCSYHRACGIPMPHPSKEPMPCWAPRAMSDRAA